MVDFIYKRAFWKIREMAFTDCIDYKDNCDVTYLHSNQKESDKCVKQNIVTQKQYTLVTSLNEDKEKLFGRIHKNCRYEIRRSERDHINVEFYKNIKEIDETEVLCDFEKIYNQMFETKGMKNRFNRQLMEKGLQSGYILVSSCISQGTGCIVYHAYLIDGESALLMYSTSTLCHEKENACLISRMNERLHWEDMIKFKELGYRNYEWGGISNPAVPNGIDKFKMKFGGEVTYFWNFIYGNTWKGKIYVWLLKRRLTKKGQ